MNDQQIIQECKRNNPKIQKVVYEQYANAMLRLCFRYVSNVQDAEDVMVIGFTKFFKNIHKFEYRGEGSLAKWIKTIMINESLMFLRSNKRLNTVYTDQMVGEDVPDLPDTVTDAETIYQLIAALPAGYRSVFNAYVIDGMSHEEISEMLGIGIGTSKSQLSRARAMLKEQIIKLECYG